MTEESKPAWRNGAHIAGVDPSVALAELQRIEQDGGLTADAVKEAARPEDAPLHPAVFDLPPGAAAEAYYSQRAGLVIRALIYPGDTPEDFERVYVFVPSADGGIFGRARVIVTQPDRWALVLADLTRDLLQARDALRRADKIAAEYQTPPKEAPRIRRAAKAVNRAVAILSPTQP